MKLKPPQYSRLIRQSSRQTHQFIRKLGCKENERIRFLFVHDAKRNRPHSTSSGHKPAIKLNKPLKLIESQVTQMSLHSGSGKPVHMLNQNAKGYAVFMEINRREGQSGEIKAIRAQFIDVDLNKISVLAGTKEQAMQRMNAIRSNPAEQIQSFAITRNKQGQYRLLAHRTQGRIAKLKRDFLKKHRNRIKNAMIIETNNGFHIYWVMQGGSISRFVPIQKALASKFGADPMITNLSRVMRVPGFYHMKNPDAPYMVRVIQWGRKKPFTQDELIASLSLKPIRN
ncbi:DNA-primase RepB domain-containing protein [Paenibacillus harenae]|uniref:DNA-primase RepB domain-containing protein n=1 Tax=Paenibacillus harenae TaxID=306543 RepID=UPI00040DBF46|nr:DNA-primase RepB domain-containing protein [Paenibacillus harenae]